MKNKTMKFLTASIITVIIACIILFTALGIFMNKKSDETLNEMGTIYMSGLNERISKHFETILDMQISDLQSVISEITNETLENYTDNRDTISFICDTHPFEYLALYDGKEHFHMIYGEQIELVDPEPFKNSIMDGEEKIAAGKTE